ncbi:MAG TPA: hypothetical protein ENF34_02275 [Candidatus Bathyarchaeota archaeon]|nr:MAG: hypothetical protein DRO60_05230 [Candidatus Bathyarchaeota archaeon]HDJ26122.1 hypothetical protein [Candidatus Bathyarchaeota archaeon]
MALDEVVERILAAEPGLKREELIRVIQERARALGVSMLRAALEVARELGVDVEGSTDVGIPIRDLVSGLSDVTVTGRIMRLWGVREFRRRDGSLGKMASLRLADGTGSVRVVLWDEKAELVRDGTLEIGQVIRIAHARTREGLRGAVEVHVGPKATIEVGPAGVDESAFPSPFPEPVEIGSVSPGSLVVSVEGFVSAMRGPTTFRRPDGSSGKVLRVRLSDGTGSITAVLWDGAADACEGVEAGVKIRLLGARVKETLTGELELHADREVQVEVLPERAEIKREELKSISELQPGQSGVDVLVKVLRVGSVRPVRTGKVATLVVADETGAIRLDLWDDKADVASQLRPGDVLLLRNAYVRERRGELVLNVGRLGSLELNPEGLDVEVPSVTEAVLKPLGEIKEPGGPFTVEVVIETAPEMREVVTSSGEAVSVASAQVSDETGQMRLSAWRDLAEQLVSLPVGTKIRVHNVRAREGPFGLELTTGVASFIEVVEEPGEATSTS